MKLPNIELRRQSITDFADDGPFDYVIAHGVFSWVPRGVRERVLEICASRLAPNGVGYVSYNVYPGWHLQGMLRDMLRRHAGGAEKIADPFERVRKAKQLLDFLSAAAPLEGGPPGSPLGNTFGGAYGVVLKGLADQIRSLPEANLYHEHLEEVNDPLYFHQFMELAASKGLQYLGEAQPDMMSMAGLGREVNDALRRVAENSGRRRAVPRPRSQPRVPPDAAGAGGRAAPAAHRPRPGEGAVRRLAHGAYPRDRSPAAPARGGGEGRLGRDVQAPPRLDGGRRRPAPAAALRALADAWPGRLSFGELVAATWGRMGLGPLAAPQSESSTAAVEKKLGALLLQGYFTGMIELSPRPANWATTLTNRPTARPLARLQAETEDTVTTLRHQNLKLNRTARHLVRLLDGSRTRADLLKGIEEAVREGAKVIGGTVELTAADRAQLSRGLEQDLKRFVAEGLLVR